MLFIFLFFVIVALMLLASLIFCVLYLTHKITLLNINWSKKYSDLNNAWATYVTDLDKKWGNELNSVLEEAYCQDLEEGEEE